MSMRSTAQPSPSGNLGRREPREEGAYHRRTLLVIDVGDLRLLAGRVGGDVALQRNGDVDDTAGQRCLPGCAVLWSRAGLSIRMAALSLGLLARPAAGDFYA